MHLISVYRAYCQSVVRSTVKNERGAALVEYALLLALIAVVCIGAITIIGQSADTKLSSVADQL